MPITYDPQHRLFKLDTNLSTYAFMVYEENYLVHLYYGAKIPDTDLSYVPQLVLLPDPLQPQH